MQQEATDTDNDMTGDATIDEALRTLDGLEERPVYEHASSLDGVHQLLQERLAEEPAETEPDHLDHGPTDLNHGQA